MTRRMRRSIKRALLSQSQCGRLVLESGGECGSRCRILSSQLFHLRGEGGEFVL